MGVADEIWQAFITAHPEVAHGHWSLQEVNQKMAAFMQARNQQPLPDFEDLSPQQMHLLLSDPWGSSSPLCLLPEMEDSLLDQIPFFRLMEVLYQHLLVQPIKLTPKGNLPLALCRELYERKLLVQEDIEKGITKKISEDNVAFLQALKTGLLLSPFVKKRQNTLSLTKAGGQALAKKRSVLFKQVLQDYTHRFNWAYLDQAQTPAGQFGWAYSLYLVHCYGSQWQSTDFYAAKVLKAFPHLREPIPSSRLAGSYLEFERVYRWRFVEQFAHWFVLVELQEQPRRFYDPDPLLIRKTPLLDSLLRFTL
ncbi:hypothetical protein LX87_05465 [Larkinella arboricola]|uniref:Uncharacterized protein n=1 Tax=Larkinella arboricola TaxID=643671 RepID=A0A327WKV3_LARAB|nr:hypothetical protein [Larkinella arboricola]RAJ90836.1 hypothetical protein LX87_05465 [Larkinella arboricola]